MHFVTFTLCAFYLFNGIESIIRNDITGRCLHLGVLGGGENESVYATACTWNSVDGEKDSQSHPDEWLEIIERNNTEESQKVVYFIRKVSNTSTPCLTTVNNQPGLSNRCFTPEASFALDIVPQTNFKGIVTSYLSFKIRNTIGQCLTVQPGYSFLQFKECSSRQGLFQVWSVCRHNRKCDVGLTWTPRHIVFPTNSTNFTADFGSGIVNTFPTKQMKPTKSKVQGESMQAPDSALVNEVLYTVQNAARLYESREHFLVNGIGAFYAKESLSEARLLLLKVCTEENLKCSLCKQCDDGQISPNITVAWLMKWMMECNASPSSKVFLSKDVLQVPYHLFPTHESSHLRVMPLAEKYKLIIPNLRKYLNELEARLNKHDDSTGKNLSHNDVAEKTKDSSVDSIHKKENSRPDRQGQRGSTGKIPDTTPIPNQNANDTGVNTSTPAGQLNATQDYASIIDIRFNG